MHCEVEGVNQEAELHFERGQLAYEKGEWREAVEHYQRGLEKCANNKEALLNLGYALSKLGDPEGAT